MWEPLSIALPSCRDASLVTRIAATSKSQIASDCNRNSKKITATPKTPSEANSLDSGTASFVWFFIVFQKRHMGLETPQNTLRLQGCDSESQRFFWPNAIFVIATLRFYCVFCGKSLRLRSCDCQSLAICDCDCVGHSGRQPRKTMQSKCDECAETTHKSGRSSPQTQNQTLAPGRG